MRLKWVALTLLFSLITFFMLGMLFAAPTETGGKRVIVVFDPVSSPAERKAIVSAQGCALIKELPLVNAMAVNLPAQASDRAREALLKHRWIFRIDEDLVIQALVQPVQIEARRPSPPPPAQQTPWGVSRIGAPPAWFNSTGLAVKVGILDTGIDTSHPDLKGNLKGGINTINPSKSYTDDNGHGTHVAGIVAALNNSVGVVGVAPQAYLYGVKVLDRNGSGWLSDLIEGLQWCINNQVKVINMSLGTSSNNQTFYQAILATYNAGIVQVAAAGNESGAVNYPAAYVEVIAVSATDSADRFASFSNYGPEIDLAGPGVSIYSTYKGSTYKTLSGTSMAAPHAAGVCALVLENQPGYLPAQVKYALTSTAQNLGLSVLEQGAGLVNANAATLVSEP